MQPSTFSIVAFDPQANELGVAVQSKFLAVGAAVPWVTGGVGAVATQAWANTSYGPRALKLLEEGHDPASVIKTLTQSDDRAEHRQVGVVDSQGRSATYTGQSCIDWAGGIAQQNFAVQGNILAGPDVVKKMAEAFLATSGPLADRLIEALRGGQSVGGDRRGKQSAALYIGKPAGGYGGFNDRYIDLRVDDHPEPIEELARVLKLHKLYFFKAMREDLVKIDAGLGAELCDLLVKSGDLSKNHSGGFDAVAQASLVAYMHRENLEERVRDDGNIDRQTLEYLREHADL